MVQLGWLAAGLAFLGGQCWFLLKIFLSGHAPHHPDDDVLAGPMEQFAPETVTHFWKERFILVHHTSGFLALSHDCTHGQCRVEFHPERRVLVCPCHGSYFSVTGAVLRGPASRPLDRYAVSLHNGQVTVHTAQRQRFEASS
jgi:Rieske Fe-S protein